MTSGNDLIPTRRSHRKDVATLADVTHPRPRPAADQTTRWSRRRGVLGVFAAFAAVGFVVAYVGPTGMAIAEANAEERTSLFAVGLDDVQTREGDSTVESEAITLDRGTYTVYVKPKPKPVAPASTGSGWRPPFVTPDPGSAQATAYRQVKARGWGDDQFGCLVALWNKESGWRVNAHNQSSGAYGIPQALPGSKMASAGADWATNAATQIRWGLGYISGRYGTPCGAWDHSQRVGWY